MISKETVGIFSKNITDTLSSQPDYLLHIIDDFVEREPHVAAFMMMFLGANGSDISVSTVMVALSFLTKLQDSQQHADVLNRDFRDGSH